MAEITDKGPNYNSNGYLSQDGRVADNMSRTRAQLHGKAESLRKLDKRVADAKAAIIADETYRIKLVSELEHARMEHTKALASYTNNIWMDIQVKPKDDRPAEPIQ